MPALLNRDVLDHTQANLTLAATYTGQWIPRQGFTEVACEWVSAGGATLTVTVEESLDGGITADRSTSAGAAGANGPAVPTKVVVIGTHVRMKIVDSVAATTTLKAVMSATA